MQNSYLAGLVAAHAPLCLSTAATEGDAAKCSKLVWGSDLEEREQ